MSGQTRSRRRSTLAPPHEEGTDQFWGDRYPVGSDETINPT